MLNGNAQWNPPPRRISGHLRPARERWGDVVAIEEPAALRPAPGVASLRVSVPEPNPSPGAVLLCLEMPVARTVTARVFDVHGRFTAVLAEGLVLPAGWSALRWDGRDRAARTRVPAGV